MEPLLIENIKLKLSTKAWIYSSSQNKGRVELQMLTVTTSAQLAQNPMLCAAFFPVNFCFYTVYD
jgi:hypothetical protein